jgi:hypothetical protein
VEVEEEEEQQQQVVVVAWWRRSGLKAVDARCGCSHDES